jgi:hypothetical protein
MLKGFYLTLMMGPVIAVPVPQPLTDALMSVQVTTTDGQRSGFQLTFAVSKKSLINTTLLPAGFFDPLVRVIIVATVNGIPDVLMDGVITRQEITPSSVPGQSTLTITGEDLTVLMDLVKLKGLPYPALPDPLIVEVILAKYIVFGLIPLVIPSLLPNVPDPLDRISQQTGTDLEYIKLLADENAYVFYLVPGPAPGTNIAYWGPKVKIGVPQPALSINMDADTNVESLSFSLDGQSSKLVIMFVLDPITQKIPIPVPLPDFSILQPPLALRPTPKLKVEVLEGTARLNLTQAALLGLSTAAKAADSVTGNGQLDVVRYGHVLKARGLVGVRGVSLAYDGLYYVSSVTHNIKRGEYKQSFTLSREGLLPLTPAVLP